MSEIEKDIGNVVKASFLRRNIGSLQKASVIAAGIMLLISVVTMFAMFSGWVDSDLRNAIQYTTDFMIGVMLVISSVQDWYRYADHKNTSLALDAAAQDAWESVEDQVSKKPIEFDQSSSLLKKSITLRKTAAILATLCGVTVVIALVGVDVAKYVAGDQMPFWIVLASLVPVMIACLVILPAAIQLKNKSIDVSIDANSLSVIARRKIMNELGMTEESLFETSGHSLDDGSSPQN